MSMDENQPTEPLPPQAVPPQHGQQAVPPQYGQQQYQQPYAQQQYQQPYAQPYAQQQHPAAVPGEPFYRRHGLAFAISTLVLAVIVLFGGVGIGTFAVANVIGHSGILPHVMQRGPERFQKLPYGQGGPQGQAPGQAPFQLKRGVLRGTISSISGSTWTVESQRGVTVTVKVSSSTVYGTPAQTQRASDFAVGDSIIVIGAANGTTVTATRVVKTNGVSKAPSSPTPSPAP